MIVKSQQNRIELVTRPDAKGDLSGSHVSLDLGGGSTQITFAPTNPNIAGIEGRKHFKHSVNVLGEDYQVKLKLFR